jgi:hypothetical protein
MPMKVVLATVALLLTALAMTASAALAVNGGPARPLAAAEGKVGFTCERANMRLTGVQRRIAKVQARIANGEAKNPDRAAKLLRRLQNRENRIEARIAANC